MFIVKLLSNCGYLNSSIAHSHHEAGSSDPEISVLFPYDDHLITIMTVRKLPLLGLNYMSKIISSFSFYWNGSFEKENYIFMTLHKLTHKKYKNKMCEIRHFSFSSPPPDSEEFFKNSIYLYSTQKKTTYNSFQTYP